MLRNKFRIEKPNRVKHNTDFVLDNFVDVEMKKILLPLYVMQCLSLAPKYSIRYGIITSNSRKFNIFICLFVVGIATAWLPTLLNYFTEAVGMYAITVLVYGISLVITIIKNSFVTTAQSNLNASFITLIQRIHKRFKFIKLDNKAISIVNWLFLIIVTAYNIAHLTARMLESNMAFVSKLLTHLIYMTIDCNSIIIICTLYLLGKLIESWISELRCICCANISDIERKEHLNKLIVAYDELIEALEVCNKLFRVPIFFAVLSTFFQVFINVQAAIFMPVWTKIMYISQIIWIKNLTLLFILCMESENIRLQLKNAKAACTVLCARETTIDVPRLLRRQGRAVGAGWLSAAGLFSVDAALPPRVLAVLATYTIVILQFYFL
nr:gustatory receptor 43.2 [Papilio memnon]